MTSLSTLEAKRYLQREFLGSTFPIQNLSLSLQSKLIHLILVFNHNIILLCMFFLFCLGVQKCSVVERQMETSEIFLALIK